MEAKVKSEHLARFGAITGLGLLVVFTAIAAEAHGVERVESQEEIGRMEAYLQSLYDRRDVRHSFRQRSGDEIDCVDIDKQPALRRPEMRGHLISTPPPLPPRPAGLQDTAEGDVSGPQLAAPEPLTGELDEDGAERQCPPFTIPIRRIRLDDLKRFRNLDDFHRKHPEPGSPLPPGADIPPAFGPTDDHQYAHAAGYNVTNYGAHTVLNLWNPRVQTGADEFSLSQLWVTRGSGSNKETLEAGIQVYPQLYGDGYARLFIYSTSDDYEGSGFAYGCYNLNCGRFVQTNSSVVIGGRFPAYSVTSGAQREVEISFVRGGSPAAWWLSVNGVWIGYYPLILFDAYGVKYSADTIDFGGEVVDDRTAHSYHTTTDMGSAAGAYPSAGYGQAAYQRRIWYYSTPTTTLSASGLSAWRTDAYCYDIAGPYFDSTSWGTYFFFGGPGYNLYCE